MIEGSDCRGAHSGFRSIGGSVCTTVVGDDFSVYAVPVTLAWLQPGHIYAMNGSGLATSGYRIIESGTPACTEGTAVVGSEFKPCEGLFGCRPHYSEPGFSYIGYPWTMLYGWFLCC